MWQVPAQFNFTRDVVEAVAEDPFRSALAFVDHEGVIERRTFRHIAGDASRWTALLRDRGLAPGDRLVVLMGNKPEWFAVLLGALKAGLVAVPCPKTASPQDVAFRIEHSGARLVVVDFACVPLLEGLDPAIEQVVIEDVRFELRAHSATEPTHDTAAGDTAFILYTSGPTGAPLGVVHTHASTWAARLQARHWLDARPTDLVWCTAPTGTTHSIWNVLLGPWSWSAEVALHDDGGLDIEERIDLLERLGVTVLCQAPSEYRSMAEHRELERFRIGIVRHAVSAGAPLSPELVDGFRTRFGLTLHDGYGQTENTILVANTPGIEVRPGSMGQPTPGHDVAVINDEGAEQFVGVEGELALRGTPPSLFAGYWNAPDLTRAKFRDGWYLTGDRAVRDEDGYLWFSGRDINVAPRPAQWIDAVPIERAPPQVTAREQRLDTADLPRSNPEVAPLAQDPVAESEGLSPAASAAAASEADALTAEALVAEAALQTRRTAAEARRAAELRAAEDERQRQEEAARREAAIAAAAQARRDEAAARAQEEEEQRAREAKLREAGIAAVAQARREEAEARLAAEARARDDVQRSKQDEKRRREEEKAAAEQARRDEAAAQRAAEAQAREEEQQRKLDEKRRREEEKAAAEQARRDEAAAQRAAEAQAREEEQQRKLDEKRRREADEAAAEQARRDEAAAQRAAEAKARQDAEAKARADAAEQERVEAARRRERELKQEQEQEQKLRAEAEQRSATPPPPPAAVETGADDASEDESEEAAGAPSQELIARLRAYGHGDDIPRRKAPRE